MSGENEEVKNIVALCSYLVKTYEEGFYTILPPIMAYMSGEDFDTEKINTTQAVMIDYRVDTSVMGQFAPLGDMLGVTNILDSLPRITKEQFYDLTT